MAGDAEFPDLSAVPLFPLPNVVLFPKAVLPLHIFEERFRKMTADALAGDKRVAMALLRPGWEKSYYGRPAIEPIVCVGQIVSHEKLPDGKYNFLLQGQLRAKIIREHGDRIYRIAELEPLLDTNGDEMELMDDRGRLTGFFSQEAFESLPIVTQLQQLIASPLPTSDVADVLAFNLIDDIALKQSLLAETNVKRRVSRIVSALEALCPMLQAVARRRSRTQSMN
ncbi:MAG TPA: LON peptidase substrate-binding domain-containing protein [Tepidisphaeraceae bacterium]